MTFPVTVRGAHHTPCCLTCSQIPFVCFACFPLQAIAVLPPDRNSATSGAPHIVASTIRARVVVFALLVSEKRLQQVAACDSPAAMGAAGS